MAPLSHLELKGTAAATRIPQEVATVAQVAVNAKMSIAATHVCESLVFTVAKQAPLRIWRKSLVWGKENACICFAFPETWHKATGRLEGQARQNTLRESEPYSGQKGGYLSWNTVDCRY